MATHLSLLSVESMNMGRVIRAVGRDMNTSRMCLFEIIVD